MLFIRDGYTATAIAAIAAAADVAVQTVYAVFGTKRAILAELLAARGALRPGLPAARAADIIWAIANPRTQHALVAERQWPAAEYESWLADLLAASLLA